jgi:hypothetical protein
MFQIIVGFFRAEWRVMKTIFKGDGPVNFNVDAEFYGPEL